MSRPRKGSLEFRYGQWWARHTITVEGVSVRRWFPLGTDSEVIARAKNRELAERIARGEVVEPAETKAPETFKQAATRVLEQAEKDGMKSVSDRRQRLRDYAYEKLGHLDVHQVRAAHVRTALERARDLGKSKQTIIHLRNDIRSVFASLWRDDELKENPCDRVSIPKGAATDDRPRQILTDDEFIRFISCAAVSRRLRMMAFVSRTLGGMRTSDLHAWRWEHIDTTDWATAQVKRPKVRGMTFIQLPAMLATELQAWWAAVGKPTSGPVFPVGRGENASSPRGHVGYARQLRAALLVAGITRPELYSDNELSKRVDFHSFRRAYTSALGDAHVNVQTAMRLTGHTKVDTHLRYVDRLKPVLTPAAALPLFRGKSTIAGWRIFNDSSGADGTRTRGLRRDRQASSSFNSEKLKVVRAMFKRFSPLGVVPGQLAEAKLRMPNGATLRVLRVA